MPPIQKAPRAPVCQMPHSRGTISDIYFYGELERCIGVDAANEWWHAIGPVRPPLQTMRAPPSTLVRRGSTGQANVSRCTTHDDVLGLLFTDAAHIVLVDTADSRTISRALMRSSMSSLF